METIKKLFKAFLQPWSTIVFSRIGSIAKAAIVGCMVSVTLLVIGWTLFSSSVDLENRSVFSVLLSPDGRTIEGQPDVSEKIGECSHTNGQAPPVTRRERDLFAPPNYDREEVIVCENWIQVENSFLSNSWTGTKYRYIAGFETHQTGIFRSDALGYAKDLWVNAGSSLLMPIVVLLVMQMGVVVGYQYFRRSSKPDVSDGEVT